MLVQHCTLCNFGFVSGVGLQSTLVHDILPGKTNIFSWKSMVGCFYFLLNKSLFRGHVSFRAYWILLLVAEIPNNHLGWCWIPTNDWDKLPNSTGERQDFWTINSMTWYFLYVPFLFGSASQGAASPSDGLGPGPFQRGGGEDDVVSPYKLSIRSCFFCFSGNFRWYFLKWFHLHYWNWCFLLFLTISKWNLSWNGFILRISDVYRKYWLLLIQIGRSVTAERSRICGS